MHICLGLTHWYNMAWQKLVNTDSGNGFLPGGTKSLHEPLRVYRIRPYRTRPRTISQELCKKPITKHITHLTHWGRVTHICVGNLAIIGSDNGLSPGRRQAIIWTNAGILLIGPLGTNFSEILIGIQTFSFKKMHLKMSSAKWRLFVSASMC